MLKLLTLTVCLGSAALGCQKHAGSQSQVADDSSVQLADPLVADSIQSVSADCSALTLDGPSCTGMQQATTIFDNISQVSGAATAICTFFPDPSTKVMAMGFAATAIMSKVVVFTLKSIPCDQTLSDAQKAEIATQVSAALAARGININGALTIPDHP